MSQFRSHKTPFRFPIKALMIFVGFYAVMLSLLPIKQHWLECRDKASLMLKLEQGARAQEKRWRHAVIPESYAPDLEQDAAEVFSSAEHSAGLAPDVIENAKLKLRQLNRERIQRKTRERKGVRSRFQPKSRIGERKAVDRLPIPFLPAFSPTSKPDGEPDEPPR